MLERIAQPLAGIVNVTMHVSDINDNIRVSCVEITFPYTYYKINKHNFNTEILTLIVPNNVLNDEMCDIIRHSSCHTVVIRHQFPSMYQLCEEELLNKLVDTLGGHPTVKLVVFQGFFHYPKDDIVIVKILKRLENTSKVSLVVGVLKESVQLTQDKSMRREFTMRVKDNYDYAH